MVEYGILGPLEVRLSGGVVAPTSVAQRLVLTVLLLAPGAVVSADRLIDELWGDGPPVNPTGALRSQLSRLRRRLGPAGPDLVATGGGYRLRVERPQLDAARFEDLVAAARRAGGEDAVGLLDRALTLWRGPVLAEFADRPCAQAEVVRLEELRLVVREDCADLLLSLGRVGEAVVALRALVTEHPEREGARASLMQALYRQGRHTDALATYQSWRRRLADELGLDPSPALQRLEGDILRHTLAPGAVSEHPDPPAPFLPLCSISVRRHNLPVALNPFVGRRAELDEVDRLLASARLVTLTGVGGAGKTRLALESAARALPGFSSGVFLVELGPLKDPALVPHQVASAIGMAVEGIDAPTALVDRLCRYLEPRRVLLLLDNCEHLVGSAAQLVEAVLARCRDVVVLATSREPLGVPGEVGWRVPPLSVPPAEATTPDSVVGSDAVALFCQRALAANPTFALLPANAPAIIQICRRLDGIPLALELAAARLRHLSPHDIAQRLDDRFRLLSGGARTALPHHQTLLAAMDWSHQLLSKGEQAALRRLSVFPDAFSLDAAEAVAADGAGIATSDVLDLLGRLVDKSLVVADDLRHETRYRLLETVRQYGAERLAEAGETEATRRRHRDFFLTLADETHADLSFWWDTRRWLARVRTDDGNFRVGLEWSRAAAEPEACLRLAVAMSYYWVLEGTVEGAAWLERSIDDTSEAMSPARVRGLACLAFFVAQGGDFCRADFLLEEARALAEGIGDVTGSGLACELLGGLHYERGDFEQAEQLLDEARRRFETEDCVAGAWGCRYDLGWLALAKGDHRRATTEFERALKLGRRSGSEDLIAHSLAALAPVLALTGDAKRAKPLADEAIETTRRLGLRLFVVMALTRAAEVEVLLGRPDQGEGALAESLSLLQDVGGQAWLADALELAALVLAGKRQPEQAARLLGACDALTEGRPSIRAIRTEVERCRDGLAHLLGRESFVLEWTRGQEQSVDQAIAYALAALM